MSATFGNIPPQWRLVKRFMYTPYLVLKEQTKSPDPGFWQTFCRTTTSTWMKECIDYSTIHLVVDSTVRFDVAPAKSAHHNIDGSSSMRRMGANYKSKCLSQDFMSETGQVPYSDPELTINLWLRYI